MNISPKDIKRFFRYFFYSTIAIITLYYLKWFLIDPFISPDRSDSSGNFRGSAILLFIYGILFVFSQITSKGIFYFATIALFLININYLNVRMPYIETTFRCNGAIYYITPIHYREWFDVEITKWTEGFNYKSDGFPNKPINKIVCDEKKGETNFIGGYDILIYSDGKISQTFYYTSAQLKNNRYFLSERYICDKWCTISSYTLYECKSDFTDCDPLPITYTITDEKDIGADFELKSDEVANTINLFEWLPVNGDEKLIFTYGKDMHCYAEGCAINGK